MKLHPKGRERLRGALLLRGMTHRELAVAIGWRSHGMVSQLLLGKRTSVSPKSAVMISSVLGIPLHDLFLPESSSDTRRPIRDKVPA